MRPVAWVLFIFALSFTFFQIQSGDVLMYLAIARDFLLKGTLPSSDPYLYSLSGAELHVAHEYLSQLLFYGAWAALGLPGLTILKIIILACVFITVLRAEPREMNGSPLWILLWVLAVLAASFRFIERSSQFSDLFCVLLVYWLASENRVTRSLIIRLTVLFLLWVQLHAGYPIGLAILGVWALWHALRTPGFELKRLPWLLLPVLALLLNPLGLTGALYPFKFAMNEAVVLKRHNFEWFPSYHPAFRFAPETIACWVLLAACLVIFVKEKALLTVRGALAVVAVASVINAVRFIPWASFALVLLIKPYSGVRRVPAWLPKTICALLVLISIKNVVFGYKGSSGPRTPRFGLDPNFFPEKTVKFLRENPIPGRMYNAHDFGSYLIWTGYVPVFHHGFVTDMNFYENDVVGVFKGQARFLELAKKYNWTKLLVDKHGSYPYFYKILSPLPEWKIVAEDDASYLIYLLPDQK